MRDFIERHFPGNLALRNLAAGGRRTALLLALIALLAASLVVGAVVLGRQQRHLTQLRERLGADITVVSYGTTTQLKTKTLTMRGAFSTNYLRPKLRKAVLAREGIGRATTQLYLGELPLTGGALTKAHVVGVEPATDFVVRPWVTQGSGDLPAGTVLAGSALGLRPGTEVTLYGEALRVSGVLAETGTEYDTALFMANDTLRRVMAASPGAGGPDYRQLDPAQQCSCVLLDVADGALVEEVLNDINLHVKGVRAVMSRQMTEAMRDSVGGVSSLTVLVATLVWLGVLVLTVAVLYLTMKERRAEWRTLRLLGASRLMVGLLMACELAWLLAGGALLGMVAGCVGALLLRA